MTYSSLSDVCSFYVNGSPEGLCSCIILGEDYLGIHRRVSDMLYTKIAFCGLLPYITPRFKGCRWTIKRKNRVNNSNANNNYVYVIFIRRKFIFNKHRI